MNPRTLSLPLAALLALGCGNPSVQTSPLASRTYTDTATEVALYGLVSWSTQRDAAEPAKWEQVVALMPSTTAPPECLGDKSPPMEHHPVLKIVAGTPVWKDGLPLPDFEGQPDVFSLAGQDVTIEEDGEFSNLRPVSFDLLSSNASLEATRSGKITGTFDEITLDPDLLVPDLPDTELRLGARVRITQGRVIASQSSECPDEPISYLAEGNTSGSDYECPGKEPIPHRTLAEEVVNRLHATGRALTLHFHHWATNTDRTVTISPSTGGGVRIELSNQMIDAAKKKDSRPLCDTRIFTDYLWYYDLRRGNCPAVAYLPCDATSLGGTKCPEHSWGEP